MKHTQLPQHLRVLSSTRFNTSLQFQPRVRRTTGEVHAIDLPLPFQFALSFLHLRSRFSHRISTRTFL